MINTSWNDDFHHFSSFIIIINIMIREIEIEISDQSDAIFSNILREKKRDVDKLINDLSSIFSNYAFTFILFRVFMFHEELRFKYQISFSIFQLFFCLCLLQIMTNHINIKINLKRIEVSRKQRSWTSITSTETEAFVEILLYISINSLSRITDYWNHDVNRFINFMIINCMSNKRWKKIERY
jgi:hypothetical protein